MSLSHVRCLYAFVVDTLARQVQSGMPGSPVAVRAGASLLGRRLPSRVRQHSALCGQLTFRLAWCRQHSAVMATELLQPRNLVCGPLF